MPDQTTETTQQTTPTPENTTTTGQGTAGATTVPAPSKKEGEQTNQTTTTTDGQGQPKKLTKEETQQRIDRMYARLQQERKQRLAAEAQLKSTPKPVIGDEDIEHPEPKPLTESDVEAVLERKDREKRFVESEMRVFEQHPDALNEDGSFNLQSPFVQKYIEIGKRNPTLALMENGPELAAAMADKETGADYKQGRVDEATRLRTQNTNTFTTSSTTTPAPNSSGAQLSEVEKRIARRMGLSDTDYTKNKNSNKVSQKSWEIK